MEIIKQLIEDIAAPTSLPVNTALEQSYLDELWFKYKGPLSRAEFYAVELNSLSRRVDISNAEVQKILDEIEKVFTDEEILLMEETWKEIKEYTGRCVLSFKYQLTG